MLPFELPLRWILRIWNVFPTPFADSELVWKKIEGHAFGLAKEKSFSILYSDGEKGEVSLDLIAPTTSIYRYWFRGIKTILEGIQDVRAKSSPDELFIKQSWEKAGNIFSVTTSWYWQCHHLFLVFLDEFQCERIWTLVPYNDEEVLLHSYWKLDIVFRTKWVQFVHQSYPSVLPLGSIAPHYSAFFLNGNKNFE